MISAALLISGSFGYEVKNYETSMKIGELVLFPAVREAERGTIIAAPGTSCRHQIKDGTDGYLIYIEMLRILSQQAH